MPRQLSVTQLARNFAEYLNRVAYRGESFILVRGGTPVAGLGPVPAGRTLGELSAMLDSIPHLAPEDVSSFAADLESGRSYLAERELHSSALRSFQHT